MNKPYDPYTDDAKVVAAINKMADDIRKEIDAEIFREILGLAEGWQTPSYVIVKNGVIRGIIEMNQKGIV